MKYMSEETVEKNSDLFFATEIVREQRFLDRIV